MFTGSLGCPMATQQPIPGIIARLVSTPKSQGGFDWVDPDITDEHFPAFEQPSLEGARLVQLVPTPVPGQEVRTLSGQNAVNLILRGKLSPATMAEGLLYGITHPDEQRTSWITCYGQTWLGDSKNVGRKTPLVLMLETYRGERRATLCLAGYGVGSNVRVLVFPKRELPNGINQDVGPYPYYGSGLTIGKPRHTGLF